MRNMLSLTISYILYMSSGSSFFTENSYNFLLKYISPTTCYINFHNVLFIILLLYFCHSICDYGRKRLASVLWVQIPAKC